MSKRFSAGGDSPASKKTPLRSHDDVCNRVPQQQHMNVTNPGDSGNIFIPCPIINDSQLSDPSVMARTYRQVSDVNAAHSIPKFFRLETIDILMLISAVVKRTFPD